MAKTIEQFVIEVDVKNAKKVEKALKGIEKELLDVSRSTEKVGKTFEKTRERLRIATQGWRRSLGAIRNNLLLVTFATEALRRSVLHFARTAASFEKMEISLISLTGSAEEAKKTFQGFIEFAAKTPFEVQNVVEAGIVLKSFGAEAEPLLEMMGDLAIRMGVDMPEAAAAFGRAFAAGRGAADVLREKGLLALIDSFAEINNLSTETLPEFRIAMIKAFSDPAGGVAGSISNLEGTLTQTFSNLSDAATRFSERVGQKLKPAIQSLALGFTNLLNWMDTTNRSFLNFLTVLESVAVGVATYAAVHIPAAIWAQRAWIVAMYNQVAATGALIVSQLSLNSVIAAFRALTIEWTAIVYGAIAIFAAAGYAISQWKGEQEDLDEAVGSTAKTLEEYVEELKNEAIAWDGVSLAKSMAENEEKLQKELDLLRETDPVLREKIRLGRELSDLEKDLVKKIDNKQKELDVEKERERILKSIAKLEQENAITALALVDKKLNADADVLEGFKKGSKARLQVEDILYKKSLAMAKIALEQAEKLDEIETLSEEDRSKAELIIRKNAADKRVEVEANASQQILDIKEKTAETAAEIQAQELADLQNFHQHVTDSYISQFNTINQQLKSNLDSRFRQELKALKKSEKFRDADAEQRQDLENDLKNEFASRQLAIFRGQQMMNIAQMFITMNRAILEIEAMMATESMAGNTSALARGAGLIKALRVTTAVQAGLVAAQAPPTFATGGSFITDGPQQIIVGDNPGGRERVDITPISSPNIDGPQGSSISINIMGNVIGTEEFVRDTLIPEIDNTIKRNLA